MINTSKSILIFLSILIITKGVIAQSSDTDIESEYSNLNDLSEASVSTTSAPSGDIATKISFKKVVELFEKAIHKFESHLPSIVKSDDSSSQSDDSLAIIRMKSTLIKLKLRQIKKLQTLTSIEKIILHSLDTSLTSFITELKKHLRKSSTISSSSERTVSFIALLDAFKGYMVDTERDAIENRLVDTCISEIKSQNFDVAFRAIQQINDDEKLCYVVGTVFDKNANNFNIVLQLSKAVSDEYKTLVICKALYHEMTLIGDKDPLKPLHLIHQIKTKFVNERNITEELKGESEQFMCKLQDSVMENFETISREDVTKYLSFAELLQILLTFDYNKCGSEQPTFEYQLNSIKEKLPIYVKAAVFRSSICLRNSFHDEYLGAVDETMHGTDQRNVFTQKLESTPVDKPEFTWKLVPSSNRAYALINVHFNGILFPAEQKFAEASQEECVRRYVCNLEKRYSITFDGLWEMQPIPQSELSSFNIKNTYYGEYLFADYHRKYDDDRRCVFTLTTGNTTYDGKWDIIDCA